MKKNIIIFILVFLFGMVIAGCSSLNNLSGTISYKTDTTRHSGASIYTSDNHEYFFSDITEAWTRANTETDKKIRFVLWQDWNASEGNFGRTSAKGFSSLGGLIIETRDEIINNNNETTSLIVNLNGYSINANRSVAAENGYVMYIDLAEDDKIHGAITLQNGTIKGGNNTGDCGGIFIEGANNTITFQNLEITGNKTEGNGGGIYEKTTNCFLCFDTLSITGNTCKSFGAGYFAHTVATSASDSTLIALRNKVLICENTQNIGDCSTGLYIYNETPKSDSDNSVPHTRFKSFNHSSDSKILISYNSFKVCLTPEIEYGVAQKAQNGTFVREYTGSDPGFLYYRTEDAGCGEKRYYGYLLFD